MIKTVFLVVLGTKIINVGGEIENTFYWDLKMKNSVEDLHLNLYNNS